MKLLGLVIGFCGLGLAILVLFASEPVCDHGPVATLFFPPQSQCEPS